ncbi:hypothetical protein [Leptospira abararensis]|uniref:hypothetical protein n=1 Tax=Leptospira abararensis TaxID=2810036 RepID=UPI001E3706E3|nr:hypothetical protein [Leptospira abararensis]
MYRVLLVFLFCTFFRCLSHQTFQQVVIPKKEYQITKRLPFLINTCDRKAVLSNNLLERYLIARIWENGEFRIASLSNEPFDLIEDLRIYQSHDYIWYLSLIPLFSGYTCDQYHLTGYLLYLDPQSKEKLYSKLANDQLKTSGPDLPIMAFREYNLIDDTILSQKIKESREKKKNLGYNETIYHNYKPKVWNTKTKSELVYLSNDNLIDYCLEFPYECVNDPIYIKEIRSRTTPNLKKNPNPILFSNRLLEKIQTTYDKIYFGCYCRKNPDFSIYESCPIDSYGLDSICKQKFDCFQRTSGFETTQNIGQNQCQKKFKNDLSVLIKTKEPKDKIHEGNENFERMIFYAKKIWALENLKELD